MKSETNNTEYSIEVDSLIKKSFQGKSYRNLDYLYPNGHRITPQMRWFKGSRDRGLRPDIAA